MGNGKVLVKTMHVFYEHSTLHQPVCRRPPPPPNKKSVFIGEGVCTGHFARTRWIASSQVYRPWAFYTTNEDYKMRGHFLQKNTIKKHEMTGKTGGWSSPFFSFFGNRWVFGLFKFSLYILTNVAVLKQDQSQLLFITNFNGEIMQSVQLFICTLWILRDGCQPRFIQFAMPSTGWSNAVFRRAYYLYQSHLYFEATSLWLFTTQPIPIVGLLIS